MKIEIGESLICSWLQHVRKCQIVQTNWRASKSWPFLHQDILHGLMRNSKDIFFSKHALDIYKKSSFSKLIGQSEIDAIGIAYDDSIPHIYAVDVAFHESGLDYGSRKETVARVVKKYLRTAMCIVGYFDRFEGDIIFASPKITPAVDRDLHNILGDVQRILVENGLQFNADLLCNERFKEEIFLPTVTNSRTVSDSSALFMRSVQLANIFGYQLRD